MNSRHSRNSDDAFKCNRFELSCCRNEKAMSPKPADFPVRISIPVQWGDQDAFGHVNNIHFLRWFESARIEYLAKCDARISSETVGPILAAVNCDYRRQMKFPDTAIISASVSKIGNSSITIQHYMWSEQQNEITAEGQSVVVMFDYQSQNPVAVSQSIRDKIAKIEDAVIQ